MMRRGAALVSAVPPLSQRRAQQTPKLPRSIMRAYGRSGGEHGGVSWVVNYLHACRSRRTFFL
jgi:hypothetical protein